MYFASDACQPAPKFAWVTHTAPDIASAQDASCAAVHDSQDALRESHAVRCCSDEIKSGYSRQGRCEVWAAEVFASAPGDGCVHSADFKTAASLCTEIEGARLCTSSEILAGCAMLTPETECDDQTRNDSACTIAACSDVTLSLFDSYGDGWAGNTIQIRSCNGTVVASGITLESGAARTAQVCLVSDEGYRIAVGGGSHASEISWSLADGSGHVLAEGGAPSDVWFGTCTGGTCGSAETVWTSDACEPAPSNAWAVRATPSVFGTATLDGFGYGSYASNDPPASCAPTTSGGNLDETVPALFEARCCSDTPRDHYVRNEAIQECESVFVASQLLSSGAVDGCVSVATWTEASLICTAEGSRMCTAAELLRGCAWSETGEMSTRAASPCASNRKQIWSDTPCELPPNFVWVVPGAATENNSSVDLGELASDGCEATTAASASVGYHDVRCCSDTELPGYQQLGNCSVFGESILSSSPSPGCNYANTYEEAALRCIVDGSRLCTKGELESRCAAGTGCGFDTELVWSSEACCPAIAAGAWVGQELLDEDTGEGTGAWASTQLFRDSSGWNSSTGCCGEAQQTAEPRFWAVVGNGVNGGGGGSVFDGTLVCADTRELLPVRCCSDRELPGYRNRGDCAVWGESQFLSRVTPQNRRGCVMEATFAQAQETCEGDGSRLCTKDELLQTCARGSGCGISMQVVWTSDRCDVPVTSKHCVTCPPNTYFSKSSRQSFSCNACPEHSLSSAGSTKLDDCKPTVATHWDNSTSLPSGYVLAEENYEDRDECSEDNGGCDDLAVPRSCVNSVGAHECGDCPDGMEGHGDRRGGCTLKPQILDVAAAPEALSAEVSADIPAEYWSNAEFLRGNLSDDFSDALQVFQANISVEIVEGRRRRLQEQRDSSATMTMANATNTAVPVKIVLQIRSSNSSATMTMAKLEQQLQDPDSDLMQGAYTSALTLGQTPVITAVCPVGMVSRPGRVCAYCLDGQYTHDGTSCKVCPRYQVATEQGDSCKCESNYYNASARTVTKHNGMLETIEVERWSVAVCHRTIDDYKTEDLASPSDTKYECQRCPSGGCVSCEDGTVRVTPGFAPFPSAMHDGRPLDEYRAEPRAVFRCARDAQICRICDPNADADCVPCSLEQQQCVGEDSSPADGRTVDWCGANFEGPLCSNCIAGHARRGFDRIRDCIACEGMSSSVRLFLVILMLIAFLVFVYVIFQYGMGTSTNDNDEKADSAPPGVALVIGNSKYKHGWRELPTACADAAAFAAALKARKYHTIHVSDASETEIKTALDTFSAALADSKVAVVFYSGHGCQQADRMNYLVGVDSKCDGTSGGCVPTSAIFDAIQSMETGLVIFDAGHENQHDKDGAFCCALTTEPLRDPVKLAVEPDGWTYEKARIQSVLEFSQTSPHTGKTLSNIQVVTDDKMKARIRHHRMASTLTAEEPRTNVIVVYAAHPCHFASEAAGADGLSAFGREIAGAVPIEQNFSSVYLKIRQRVLSATNGSQLLWEYDNLSPDHTFSLSGEISHRLEEEDEEAWSMLQDALEYTAFDLKGSAGAARSASALVQMSEFVKEFMPSFRSFVSLTQILSAIPFAFDFEWPEEFRQVVSWLRLFQLDIFGALELGCVGSWTFHDTLVAHTTMPVALIGFIYMMYAYRKRKLDDEAADADTRERLFDRVLEFGFFVIFLVYPVVSQTVFQAFICQQLEPGDGAEDNLLVVDFQTSCNTPTHKVYMAYASVMIIYPVGLPLLFFYVLYRNKDELKKEHSVIREELSPLVQSYRADCWYWEALEMLKKIILTGLLCFFYRGSTQQLVLGGIMASFFLCGSVSARPFITKFDNDFKIVTDAALMMTFSLSILLGRSTSGSEDGPIPALVLSLFLLFANFIVVSQRPSFSLPFRIFRCVSLRLHNCLSVPTPDRWNVVQPIGFLGHHLLRQHLSEKKEAEMMGAPSHIAEFANPMDQMEDSCE